MWSVPGLVCPDCLFISFRWIHRFEIGSTPVVDVNVVLLDKVSIGGFHFAYINAIVGRYFAAFMTQATSRRVSLR